jgi:DNA-binding IscR family transcriptional regulator
VGTSSVTLLDIVEAVEGPLRGIAEPVAVPPDRLDRKLARIATVATDAVRKELRNSTVEALMTHRVHAARSEGRRIR